MITSLQLINFKNFANEKLGVGPFTVLLGANASGKSNIRDAFRVLHGIGRGYTLAEIIGGKYGVGGQPEWAPIRGAADEIIRFGRPTFSLRVEMQRIRLPAREGGRRRFAKKARYSIKVSRDEARSGIFRVAREELKVGSKIIYASHPGENDPVHAQDDDTHLLLRMAKAEEQRKLGHRIAVRPDQPALTQIREHRKLEFHKDYVEAVADILANMRFLDLEPNRMRQATFPGQMVLGDGGENLPTVLREICADRKRKEILAEWTRELTPMDVQDFEFPTDPTTGLVQLAFREKSDRIVSAYAASDGTLRFLAMLAALLGRKPARLYVFEEIDNGIHPSRMRLLLDLIEGQTAKKEVRVVTTTHSPDLLSMVGDDTFEDTSVVCRRQDTDDAVIRRVAELPRANELRQTQGLGPLHVSGWMEDAIEFTEESSGDEEDVE